MTRLTPVLTRNWDRPDSFTIDGYGEYAAAKKALGMDPTPSSRWSRTRGCAVAAARASRPA